MKKCIMLGVNSKRNRCCELRCLIPFEKLIPSELEESDFSASPTNWGGNDDIDRTLGIIQMKQTGRKIMLDNPITFHGKDCDWGQTLPWEFKVDEIHELTPTASDK